MSKRWIVLSTLPLVVAAPFVGWVLLDDPETRLAGMVLLAALLGCVGVFLLPALFIARLEGRLPTFREASRWALQLAGIGLTVGVLAFMGSIERGDPEYVWRYGEPGQVDVDPALFCTLGRDCSGSWVSGGREVTIRLSEAEFERLRGDAVEYPDEYPASFRVDARILDDRATSAGFDAQPASSVALGRIPVWLGWVGGGVALAGFLLAALVPRRRSYSYY